MSETHRIRVKILATNDVDDAPLVGFFHQVIRDNSLGELLVDVADYRHVHHGPSVLLIGHASDYAFDRQGGRPGLFHHRKREGAGDLGDHVADGVRRAAKVAHAIEKARVVPNLAFDAGSLEVQLFDRLEARAATELETEVRRGLHRVYAGAQLMVLPIAGASRRAVWGVRVGASPAPSLAELAGR